MLQWARGAQHQVPRSVCACVVLPQIVLAQSAHGLPRTGDLLPERVRLEEGPLREIVDVDVAPLLVDLVEDLLEDDFAFELDFLEERTRQHVAEHGEGELEPLRVDGRVVVAVVARGHAVQVPADVLDD